MSVMLANTRTPSETRPPRMEPLARLPVFFALEGKRAVVAGGNAGRGLEGRVALRRRRGGRRLCAPSRARSCCALAADPPRGSIAIHRRAWDADDFAALRIAIGACDDRRRGRALRRRRARRRRPGQRHRQAGVLRLLVRRHRQPLAAGDRHLDRRRGAGVRPGDPRQARSADPARLCALGGGRAALAQRRARRPACRSTRRRRFWQIFTAHAVRASRRTSRAHSDFERLLDGGEGRERERRQGLGHAGRRRPRRSGTADAARGARAAIRRRHPVSTIWCRRTCSISRAARRRRCWSARPATAHPASSDEINALMVRLAKRRPRVVRLKGGDPMIFGRAGEEIAACRKARIAVEVVPGITAAVAAAPVHTPFIPAKAGTQF